MTDAKPRRRKDKLFKSLSGQSKTESVYVSSDRLKMSEDSTSEDVQSICRVCLSAERKELVPFVTAEDSSLADMFTALTSIDIQNDPTLLCELCRKDLENSYKFRTKCIESDSIIKSFLSKEMKQRQYLEQIYENELKSPIKEEDEEVMDVQYLEDLSDEEVHYKLEDAGAENNAIIEMSIKEDDTLEVIKEKKNHNRNYYCPSCNKKFKRVKALRAHTRQQHAADARACAQCGEPLASERDRALHEPVHAKGPPWRCIQCHKEFHKRAVFRRHVRRHMARRHACERCGARFAERHALRRHARVHSGLPAPRAHACHLCDKRYSESSLLATHLLRHSGARPCECGTCGKAFPTARLLASHALVHSDHKPHACSYCDKRFRHESTLRTHHRTHTGEKPYVCSVCGKTFIQNSNLTLHMRTHTGERPYACGVCGRRFTSGSSLKSHARTHTGEKPYGCEICGKRSSRHNMRAHMRLHSGERPFACSACPKAFVTASRLRDHMRIHTGEKPFECALCPQKYTTKSHLAKHVKSHEPKRQKAEVVLLQRVERAARAGGVVFAELGAHEDIGDQVPLEVTGELVLQENGEVKTELVMVEDQNICLTADGVNFVNNDINYANNVNLVTVSDGADTAAGAERGVKLYQLDQSLVQIHSAGGQVTISQITSKMTANF